MSEAPIDDGEGSPSSQEPQLDRDYIRQLTATACQRGAVFGRDLELTDQSREQITLVTHMADASLATARNTPEWAQYLALLDEGINKGLLTSFATHPESSVPTTIIKGDEQTGVIKILTDNNQRSGIQVPPNIYNLIHWTNVISDLEGVAKTSNETLYGRSTSSLGYDLQQIGAYLKSMGLIEDKPTHS